MGASKVNEIGELISDLDYSCIVDAKRFTEILIDSYSEDLIIAYKTAFKEEATVTKLSKEQFEKLINFVEEDLIKPEGLRNLKGINRRVLKDCIDRIREGVIFKEKLKLKDRSSLKAWLVSLEEEYGKLDFSVKRVGGFEDGPFVEIN